MPGQPFEIDELTFNVLHRLTARAHQVMMRFEIAVDAQGGGVRRGLAEQCVFHEETQVVVNGGQGNRRNAFSYGGVDLFRRAVAVGSDYGFIDDVALVSGGKAALPGQIPELRMRETHNY